MASEPMLPRFSWIQEQDAVIRIIKLLENAVFLVECRRISAGTQNSVFCAGAGLFLVLESRLPGRS